MTTLREQAEVFAVDFAEGRTSPATTFQTAFLAGAKAALEMAAKVCGDKDNWSFPADEIQRHIRALLPSDPATPTAERR